MRPYLPSICRMLSQKSPFTSRISPPMRRVGIRRAIGQHLIDVRIHAAAGLAAAHRADDQHAGIQAFLGDLQPARMFGALHAARVMHLAEHERQRGPSLGRGVRRQRLASACAIRGAARR